MIGGSDDFDGSDDDVKLPALDLDANTATITAWVKGVSKEDHAGIVFCRQGNTIAGIYAMADNRMRYNWNDIGWDWEAGLTIPVGTWSYLAVAVDPVKAMLYIDDRAQAHVRTHDVEEFDGYTAIGWNGNAEQQAKRWAGTIDEVRVSRVTRSADWLWACWMNIASNSTFNAYGEVQAAGGTAAGRSQTTSQLSN
jgi:hypothetical protein